MPEPLRSRMHSPYMEWAKTQAGARYNLAASGMPSYTLAEFSAITGARLEDLELSAPGSYGYPPLQQALAAKAGVEPDCVVAAAGTSLANHLAMAAILEPGDEVLIEKPTYELLVSAARYLGATVRRFERRFEDGYRVDPREVERALTPRTRLIVITNLHNPSSAFTGEDTLRAIGDLARGVNARVLVDEVYLESLYAKEWRPAIHLGDRFVVTSSLTKAYGLSGLRCGWALAEPGLARAMWRLNDFYGVIAAHPAERLSAIALAHLPALAERHRATLAANRPAALRFLDSRPGLSAVRPADGTVLFPKLLAGSVERLCGLLRQKYETSLVPGSFFEAPEHFRMFLGADAKAFHEGLSRLGAALDELS